MTFILRVFFKSLSLLPLRLLHALASLAGSILSIIPNNARRTCARNIAMCFPELDENKQAQLVKASLQETLKGILELGHLWYSKPESLKAKIHSVAGRELLQQALAKNEGVLLALPHLGSWEALSVYLPEIAPTTGLFRVPRQKKLLPILMEGRCRSGVEMIAADPKVVRKIYRALQQGRCVVILPDQQPKQGDYRYADFFNTPAATMTLLPKLVSKTGAPLLYTFVERLPGGQGYKIHFREPDQAMTGNNLDEDCRNLNRNIEQCVRLIPAQYQWTYKRFGMQENGISPYKNK